jgi:hypothetical protein
MAMGCDGETAPAWGCLRLPGWPGSKQEGEAVIAFSAAWGQLQCWWWGRCITCNLDTARSDDTCGEERDGCISAEEERMAAGMRRPSCTITRLTGSHSSILQPRQLRVQLRRQLTSQYSPYCCVLTNNWACRIGRRICRYQHVQLCTTIPFGVHMHTRTHAPRAACGYDTHGLVHFVSSAWRGVTSLVQRVCV